ncbi:MAG: 4-hydroxythreonine-4-phosphate dehydrogenase PdxA [Planctomycetota bacterium]
MQKLPRIAITMGDPAGIGPEISFRVLRYGEVFDRCKPLVFGDAAVMRRSMAVRGEFLPDHPVLPADSQLWDRPEMADNRPVIIDIPAIDAQSVEPGQVSAATGRAAYTYVERAIEAALTGRVDAVVTAPIHKEALQAAGIPYPGHTEIFAARTASPSSCMLLTSDQISCSFVTTHVGLRDVPGLITTERILETIELTAVAMRQLRGRAARLACCALNPHAGEHGLFGDSEEERIILPAIEAARKKGIKIEGPLPPDTAFLPAKRAKVDCYICMYHDQGLIPLKALAFDLAVNVTLGLPIIRTSVDHGTACDIAWQGKAETTSMTEAIKLAVRLASTRNTLGRVK